MMMMRRPSPSLHIILSSSVLIVTLRVICDTDCVDHLLLFEKLLKLLLKSNVILWLMNFLLSRSQAVMYNGHLSNFLFISRSIVQSSGIGPILFIIFVADIYTLSSHNVLSKYAEDTTLISPQTAVFDCNSVQLSFKLKAPYLLTYVRVKQCEMDMERTTLRCLCHRFIDHTPTHKFDREH